MWDKHTLEKIDRADDLKIAPRREDGKSIGTLTWIWEVVVDGRLFVRAYNGTRSRWYRAAIAQKVGEIQAIGKVFEVRFVPVDDDALSTRIDAAYGEKYASSPYMAHMVGASAKAATVEVLPLSSLTGLIV